MKKIAKITVATALGLGTICGALRGYKGEMRTAFAENPYAVAMCTGAESLNIRAKSAYLMDFATQTEIFSLNEKKRLPIASMCKIMTLLLCFEAIESGNLRLDEEVQVSERAASMGGSQVFLEAGAKYPVTELIKSIVVCSANDSCVALSERIAGNEALFVEKMNERAHELGANDTLYANCTGLPKEPQYSCAKDVAIILKALLGHEKYYEYGSVWMDKFQHPKGRHTEITNTNKLIRFYDGCDGGKTGFTSEAGFCLGATAKRGEMRVISVVIGEESSANRFEDVKTMFDYAFAGYTLTPIVCKGVPSEVKARVHGGKQKDVEIVAERTAYAFTKRGEKADVSVEYCVNSLKAPFEKGEKAGEIIVFQKGVERERIPLITATAVEKATIFDRWQDVARNWNARK